VDGCLVVAQGATMDEARGTSAVTAGGGPAQGGALIEAELSASKRSEVDMDVRGGRWSLWARVPARRDRICVAGHRYERRGGRKEANSKVDLR